MLDYHPVTGYLVALRGCIQAMPRDTTMHVVIQHMMKQFPKVVVANTIAAAQVEAAFLDKPRQICDTLEIINGGSSLMTMHANIWKQWRGLFNPGFAAGYVTGLAPAFAEEVALEEYTLRLTFDVIARATLLTSAIAQFTQGSALADCFERQIYWTPFGTRHSPFQCYFSLRPLVDMSRKAFKKLAKLQLRMFLYAGHDTTSSTLLYSFLLLSKNSDVLSKLRKEHDKNDPSLMNQIAFNLAVIKEGLRIFPPAGSLRDGSPDFGLIDEESQRYHTRNCHIWTLSLAMHHRPTDQRSCIGQTLAQMEPNIGLDSLHPKDGIGVVEGNRAYQSEMGGGGAHRSDGFSVRVTLKG
ncbi:cytochrome P450 [Nemania serpens]|nr:cytochrome P450 [Nemania serpens]